MQPFVHIEFTRKHLDEPRQARTEIKAPVNTSAIMSHLARVNANVHCGTVDLFPGYSLNVDDPPLPVDCYYFAFPALNTKPKPVGHTCTCYPCNICCPTPDDVHTMPGTRCLECCTRDKLISACHSVTLPCCHGCRFASVAMTAAISANQLTALKACKQLPWQHHCPSNGCVHMMAACNTIARAASKLTLYVPLTTLTSSSFRTGTART